MHDVPVRNTVCLAVRHWLLADLLVRPDVKLDKQEEIACEQRAAKDRGSLRSSTTAKDREAREVAGRIVRVS